MDKEMKQQTVAVRLKGSTVSEIDRFASAQPIPVGRSYAVRHLIERGLAAVRQETAA